MEYCSITPNGITPIFVILFIQVVMRVNAQPILATFRNSYLVGFAFSCTISDLWFPPFFVALRYYLRSLSLMGKIG